MVQLVSGEWYCPNHGLLLAAKELVSLYGAGDDADWAAIAAIVGQELPGLITSTEAREQAKLS
jgi:hypothetical protein